MIVRILGGCEHVTSRVEGRTGWWAAFMGLMIDKFSHLQFLKAFFFFVLFVSKVLTHLQC
jgi:hypothetical protein